MNEKQIELMQGLVILLMLAAICAGSLALRHLHNSQQQQKPKQNKGIVINCKTCNATGVTKQDTNLLTAEGFFAMWYNGHVNSNKCEICSKDKLCEAAQKKNDEIMQKYKELGPKIEESICPSCMGSGSYTQFDGYRFGREKP